MDQPITGLKVPNFSALMSNGNLFTLNENTDNLLVLFFYPKDSTPGCTAESIDFSTLKGKFQTLNCSVIGVSKDSVKSHLKFIDKSNLSVELISDSDGALCDMFGVMKMKNMYGKKYLGIERSTFLIGLDGKIVKEWRKVKVPGHATEVYDFVAKLSES